MNAKRIMIAGALALGVLVPTQMADATPNGLGDCLERVDVLGNHTAKCGPMPLPLGVPCLVFGFGHYNEGDPECEAAKKLGEAQRANGVSESPVYVSSVTVTRDVVNVELGTATASVARPIELLPRFTG